jgi:peptidoglycan/LPS O-acetylase OafA/YrhL
MTADISQPPMMQPTRIAALDLARIIAALGIVWLHAFIDDFDPRMASFGRFAVPFFLFTAIYLQACRQQRNPSADFGEFAVQRFRRLYVPFLAWTAIYCVAAQFKRRFISHLPLLHLGPGLLVAGSSLQLWFLPCLLLMSLALFPVVELAIRLPRFPTAFAFGAAGLALCFWPVPWHGRMGLYGLEDSIGSLVVFGWEILPSACWGIGLSLIHPRFEFRISPPQSAAWFCVAAAATIVVFHFGRSEILENLAGAAVFFAAVHMGDGLIVRKLQRLGPGAYGVYLIHLLFMEFMFAFLPYMRIANSFPVKIGEFLCASLLSIASVQLLLRWRGTAWLVS